MERERHVYVFHDSLYEKVYLCIYFSSPSSPLCKYILYIYISCHNFFMIIIITRKVWVEAKKSKQQLPEVKKKKDKKKKRLLLSNTEFCSLKWGLPTLQKHIASFGSGGSNFPTPCTHLLFYSGSLLTMSPCEVGLCMPVQVDESITCFHGE